MTTVIDLQTTVAYFLIISIIVPQFSKLFIQTPLLSLFVSVPQLENVDMRFKIKAIASLKRYMAFAKC